MSLAKAAVQQVCCADVDLEHHSLTDCSQADGFKVIILYLCGTRGDQVNCPIWLILLRQ
jgi:hypothetical protein